MLRLILLLFVITLVFGAMWRMLGGPRQAGGKALRHARMVRCAHCDLYLPEEEALRAGEEYYCGEEHRRSGPRANG